MQKLPMQKLPMQMVLEAGQAPHQVYKKGSPSPTLEGHQSKHKPFQTLPKSALSLLCCNQPPPVARGSDGSKRTTPHVRKPNKTNVKE